MIQKGIVRSKTFWAGVSAIVGAAAAFFTGEMALQEASAIAVPALIGIFVRDGIEKIR